MGSQIPETRLARQNPRNSPRKKEILVTRDPPIREMKALQGWEWSGCHPRPTRQRGKETGPSAQARGPPDCQGSVVSGRRAARTEMGRGVGPAGERYLAQTVVGGGRMCGPVQGFRPEGPRDSLFFFYFKSPNSNSIQTLSVI